MQESADIHLFRFAVFSFWRLELKEKGELKKENLRRSDTSFLLIILIWLYMKYDLTAHGISIYL